ncbi:MAG TPA: protease complex subunit PrcB family protein [Gemmatimonadaceae bacterium]|nr:protease complex subunit PrcB family protein [Gemmatimonadaceae bacterium]
MTSHRAASLSLTALGRVVLVALTVYGCEQRQDAARETSSDESQRTRMATSDSLPIRRPEASDAGIYRYSSGIGDSTFTTVRDAGRWDGMWRRLTARHGPPRPPPPIEFDQEMALVATLGEKRSGGYAIEIEAVIDRGTYVEAYVLRRAPGRDCGVAGMLTAPADVAIVPRRDVDVRVVTQDRITDCSARRDEARDA